MMRQPEKTKKTKTAEKPVKGKPGYLDATKRNNIRSLFIYVLVIAGFWIASSFCEQVMSALLKVVAALVVLPGANVFVHIVAMWPYRSLDPAEYEDIEKSVNGCKVLTEMAITNSDGPTVFVPYAVVAEGKIVVCYRKSEKKDQQSKIPSASDLSKYLERRLRLSEVDIQVEVMTEEKRFRQRVATLTPDDEESMEKAAAALLTNCF